MKKFAIIFISVVAFVWLVGSLSKSNPDRVKAVAAEQASAARFAESVSAAVKANPKWSGIQSDEAAGQNYKLTLLYRAMPANQAEVERDTRRVAQAALNELVRQGRQPAQEHIFLTVRAHKPETGTTGQNVVRVFGRAVYDYNADTIEYKAKQAD